MPQVNFVFFSLAVVSFFVYEEPERCGAALYVLAVHALKPIAFNLSGLQKKTASPAALSAGLAGIRTIREIRLNSLLKRKGWESSIPYLFSSL
ncbi:MAG: hypothetical protein K5928_06560 [Prevotella sp.]|nr:hypothetical protein [Prevotella sp.]